MYFPYKNGTSKRVGYDGLVYTVQFPEVGYIWNRLSGRYEKREILFANLPIKQQKWKRTHLVHDYRKRRAVEIVKQQANPDYIDEELEKFREQEWDRRINGVWLSINGKPIYITGLNYFYLNWWELYFDFPIFRFIDVEFFWFWEYVCENPKCYGANILGARQIGKSAKGGVILFEKTSRLRQKFSGFQSKEKEESKTNFKKYVVDPYLKLPDFFKAEYTSRNQLVTSIPFVKSLDSSKNISTNDEIDQGLNSTIQLKASGEGAFDSQTMDYVWIDEGGKREDTDIDIMWGRTKPAMYNKQTGVIRGKAYFCTTIEELNSVNPFIEHWAKSSIVNTKYKLQPNGQTISGLLNFFIPADVSRRIDEFGFPLREESMKEILNERSGITEMHTLYEVVRKDPLTVKEAMDSAKATNPFNMQVLNAVWEKINIVSYERKGNIVWAEYDKRAMWVDDAINGRWCVSWGLPEHLMNNVDVGYGSDKFYPKNSHRLFMACDPVKTGSSATSKQKSSIATTVYRRDMETDEDNNNFIADYLYRPDDPEEGYEDQIIACMFFGTKLLIEKLDSTHIRTYMTKRGYGKFIADTPEELLTKKTMYSESVGVDATVKSIGYSIGALKTMIQNRGQHLKLKRLVEDLMKYDPSQRTKYDLVVAAGFTIIQAETPYEETNSDFPITDLFRMAYGSNFSSSHEEYEYER